MKKETVVGIFVLVFIVALVIGIGNTWKNDADAGLYGWGAALENQKQEKQINAIIEKLNEHSTTIDILKGRISQLEQRTP